MLLTRFGTGSQGGTTAQSIDLDGTNDYLSRASDFTGNADGKTFTFSAWFMSDRSLVQVIYSTGTDRFICYPTGTNTFLVSAKNAAGAVILSATATVPTVALNTFNHILISIDLANAANRGIYVNDVAATVTWTTYTNDSIDFTNSSHEIGSNGGGGNKLRGRLSNIFLDYTYRNLSDSANRRLFITADRKPTSKATLQALNGIIYMPCDDPATSHINLGYGGSFTLNGTIARSGRGPNQHNAAYSDLDGAADYLSRTTAPTGIADGKQFTTHFTFNADAAGNLFAHHFTTAGSARFIVTPCNTNNALRVQAYNAAGSVILDLFTANNSVALNRNYVVDISIDLTDTGKRHVYLNGVAQSVTWNTYTNDTIQFNLSSTPKYHFGANNTPAGYFNGRLGSVFFHTTYIDLSTASNLAKFVTGTGIDAKPVDLGASGELPLGTSPLIYLPMYGNDAGNNRGTGGAFTVNSGPFSGSKGPNEFFGNKADFDGSTGYLARTSALTSVGDGKTFSLSFWINSDGPLAGGDVILSFGTGAALRGIVLTTTTTALRLRAFNASSTAILDVTLVSSYSAGTPYFVQLAVDLSNSSNRRVYVDGVAGSPTWNTYTNDTISFTTASVVRLGATADGGADPKFNGKLSEFLFTTDYIDFSLESNRLLFRDAFGSPTNLPAKIAAGTVANPLVYLRFDPADQGANEGTGGAFVKSGSIADGGQLG